MTQLRAIHTRALKNLIAYRRPVAVTNNPPVWDSQPIVSFTFGVVGNVDFDDISSDPDLDPITHSLNTGVVALPTGVTWTAATGVVAYDGVGAEAQTNGHIATLDDATDTTDSDPFSISITSGHTNPRLAAARIGERNYGTNTQPGQPSANTDEQAAMALCDFSIVNGQPRRGTGFHDALQDWIDYAAANGNDHAVYQYFILQETGGSLSGDVHDKLVAEDGPPGQTVAGGSPVPENCWYGRDGQGNLEFIFAETNYAVNLTAYVVADSNSDIWGEAFFESNAIWIDDYVTPYSPGFTGYYCDVFDHRPREDGLDYAGTNSNNNSRSGWNDNGFGEEVADAYREGGRRGLQRLIDNHPGKLVSINGTTSPMESTQTNPRLIFNSKGQADVHPEYENLVHSNWAEGQSRPTNEFGFCGFYSNGTRSSFGTPRLAMNNYLYWMRHALAPKHVMNQFEIEFDGTPVRDPRVPGDIDAEAYELCLFATAMTLQSDGYIGLTCSNALTYGLTFHLDCFGTVNTGTTGLSGKGWLGNPIEDPLETREWSLQGPGQWIGSDTGVYKRRFQNGGAMLSMFKPTGNDEDPVTGGTVVPVDDMAATDWSEGAIPGGTIKRINGLQYPGWDDDTVIDEANFPSGITLPYRHGLIWENV